jgi:glycosyltransferase involved in cell wall biosynthesis
MSWKTKDVILSGNSLTFLPRKKVLFVIDTLELGGAEQSLLANISRFKNTEGIVCHLYRGETLKSKFLEKGIKVYSLNIERQYGFVQAGKQLKAIVKKECPDIIVAYLTRSELVARLVGKFNNIPVIGTFVHDLYAKKTHQHLSWLAKQKVWFFKQLNKLTCKICVGFVANSQFIKESNAKRLSVPLSKIKVINRGRDSSLFACKDFDFKRSDVTLRFVNVSRLVPVKGQLELIEAFKKFVDQYPYAELHIVGEGVMREKLERAIKEFELEGKVVLLGARKDVPDLLALYDCFVFPTHVEGFSGALVEAMFAGLPVLASDIQQNKEAVTHMETGFLFEVGNVNAITNAFFWFRDNEGLAKTLAKKANAFAKERFELDNIAREFEYYLHNAIIYQN